MASSKKDKRDKKDKKYKEKDKKKYHKDYKCDKKSSKDESSDFDKKFHDESSNHGRDESNGKFFGNHHDADVVQDADQYAAIEQESNEFIFIKDSCNIQVQTTNTQAAISLQVGLQLAIALVVRISIGDTITGENISEELLEYFDQEQINKQKIIIENSKDITITTTDTDLAVNIQALLEVLLSLVAKLDVL